ncbi:MAG: hypothetical protein G01um101429_651 [Parcubacteria group bacterium Gr01-1014_29]|nr:MAG: hypothetical protein G01um101429_651 [Parcubacteria group bacterium Gr01-1014_29]
MNTNNKIIWGVVGVMVLVAGAWLFFRNKKEPAAKPLAEKAVGVHYAGGGVHVVEGTVALPNPCYALSVAVEKRGSSPEKVLLRFTATPTADVCAEVIYSAPFRATFDAADNAELSATINDIPIALDLEPRARVSADARSIFSLTQGEERWVEDMLITFTGVEDDSRCPVDVVCVQAGWVTLRFLAGGEEILLRLPGDSTVPNALVVGSYIITLVNVEPPARSDKSLESLLYSATLRVELHDTKG